MLYRKCCKLIFAWDDFPYCTLLVFLWLTVRSPRFDVTVKDMHKWVANLLPSRQFGKIILTTSQGIMDHEEARKKRAGGKILGYFY